MTIRYIPSIDDFAPVEQDSRSRRRNELIELIQPGDPLGRVDGGHIGNVIAIRVQALGAALVHGDIADDHACLVPRARGRTRANMPQTQVTRSLAMEPTR